MSARCGELFDVTRSIVVFAAAASLTIAAGAGVSFAQSEPGAGAAGATKALPPGAASIAFGVMSPKDIPDDAKTWETAVMKLSGRLMPPPGQKQPPQTQINAF